MLLLTRTLHQLLIQPWLLLGELIVLKSALNDRVVASLRLCPGIDHYGFWLLLTVIFVLNFPEIEVNDREFNHRPFIFVLLKVLPRDSFLDLLPSSELGLLKLELFILLFLQDYLLLQLLLLEFFCFEVLLGLFINDRNNFDDLLWLQVVIRWSAL